MFQRLLKLLGILALTQGRKNDALNSNNTNPLITSNPSNSESSDGLIGTSEIDLGIDLEVDAQSNSREINFGNSDNKNRKNSFISNRQKSLDLKAKADKLFSENRTKETAQIALDLVNEAIALNPNYEWMHFDKGLYLAKLGRNQDAIYAFNIEIARKYNADAVCRSYYERAFVHMALNNFKKAFADMEAAEKHDENKILSKHIENFYKNHLKDLERENKLEELQSHQKTAAKKITDLITTTEKLTTDESLSIPSQQAILKVFQHLKNNGAFKIVDNYQPIQFYSENSAYERLVVENYQKGNFEEAINFFDKQIKEFGYTHFHTFHLLGLSKINLGNNSEGIIDIDRVIEIREKNRLFEKSPLIEFLFPSGFKKEWLCHNRGIAYANLGLFEEALNDFNAEISINPNSQSAIHQFLINTHLGREEEAKKSLETFLETHEKEQISAIFFNRNITAVLGSFYFICGIAASLIVLSITKKENETIHRTDKEEIKGAIKQLSESVFAYLDISEEQKKSFAEVSPQKVKEICNDLNKAKSTDEIREIFSKKYNEELSPELAEFFEQVYGTSIPNKTTTFKNFRPVNFVYNSAIKSDKPVTSINQNKLKEYIKIFDELVSEGVENEISKSATEVVVTEIVSKLIQNFERENLNENQAPQTKVTTSQITSLNDNQQQQTL